MAEDVARHAQRERAFVAVAKSRLLQARIAQQCQRSRWLVARSRFLLKRTWRVSLRTRSSLG